MAMMVAEGWAGNGTLEYSIRLARSGGVPRRAFWGALVVGTLLNRNNQGDAILAGGGPNWVKLALTYLVPYAVSTHGAVSAQMRRRAGV